MILVDIEALSVGDQDPDGILFDVRLIPATSDVPLRKALDEANHPLAVDADGDVWMGTPFLTGFERFDRNLVSLGSQSAPTGVIEMAMDANDHFWVIRASNPYQAECIGPAGTSLATTVTPAHVPQGDFLDLAVDRLGNTLYLLERHGWVFAFDTNGVFQRAFAGPGSHPWAVEGACRLTVDQATGDVHVLGRNRIYIFNYLGQFLRMITVLQDATRLPSSSPGTPLSGMTTCRHMARGLRSRHLQPTGSTVWAEMETADALTLSDLDLDAATGDSYVLGQSHPPVQVLSEAGHWVRGVLRWGTTEGTLAEGIVRLAVGNERLYTSDGARLQAFDLVHPYRDAIPEDDQFQLFTDGGLSPTRYRQMILDETRAYLTSEYGLTVPEADLVVLGWNDARFYGSSAYEDYDDFLSDPRGAPFATYFAGKFEWTSSGAIVVGSGQPYTGASFTKQADTAEHAGVSRLAAPYAASGATFGSFHLLMLPDILYPTKLTKACFVGRMVSSPNFTELFMGLANPSVSTSSMPSIQGVSIGLHAAHVNTFWRILRRTSAGGTVSYLTSPIPVIQNRWMKFELEVLSATGISTVTITYQVTLTDLFTGEVWKPDPFTWSSVFPAVEPMFFVRQGAGTAAPATMDVDYFGFRLEDLTRVLPEY